MWDSILLRAVLLVLFCLCMLSASASDLRRGRVYDYVWWIALAAGLALLLLRGIDADRASAGAAPYTLADHIWLSMIFLLQETLMARSYGRADSHAFCACALVQAGLGFPVSAQLVQMAVSLLALTLVQLGCGNIRRNGTLRSPVPFVPYIALGFAVSLILNLRR